MIITPEKRISLIKLGAITLAVLFAFWFFLIGPAQSRTAVKAELRAELAEKIKTKKQIIQQGEQLKPRLLESSRQLQRIENQMVSGDNYLWIIKTLRDFEIPERLEFNKYDPPLIVESPATANLPYKTVSFVVMGAGAYHDLGRFLARFENLYPHVRITRLDMEPIGGGVGNDEKLSFLIEFHVLLKKSVTSKAAPAS